MELKEIGNRIAELRKNKGMTQNDLAQKLIVSDKTISKWENGNGLPETMTLVPLAEVLGVTIDYILTGIDPNKIKAKDISEFVKDDILDIKGLINYGDLNLLKKGLNEYPIHKIEKLIKMYEDEDFKGIYRYSIDYDIYRIKECFTEGKINELEQNIVNELWINKVPYSYSSSEKYPINYAYLFKNANPSGFRFTTFGEIKSYITNRKRMILDLYTVAYEYLLSNDKSYLMSDLERGYPNETASKLYERIDKYFEVNYYDYDYLSHRIEAYCKENEIGYHKYDKYPRSEKIDKILEFIDRINSNKSYQKEFKAGELRDFINAAFEIMEV